MNNPEKLHLEGTTEIYAAFRCPGCRTTHSIPVRGTQRCWGWNESTTSPTFTPSLLISSGHYVPGHKEGDACWCTYNREHPAEPAPFECTACHSFVRDGQIEFLPDCSHSLAGQTIAIPEWKDAASVNTLRNGLYRVKTPYLCAAFVIANSRITLCAPILRNKIDYWKTIARRIGD